MGEPGWASERHRTAIARSCLSVPARQAFIDGQLYPDRKILDFGCGRGDDVRALKRLDCQITGWDPHFQPHAQKCPADVVLMTYVLNVIEDPAERRETLRTAWALARTVLIVSARLTWERSKVHGDRAADGVLTSRGTFQHLFATHELRQLVEDVTGSRCVAAAPGIIYAFRDEAARLSYLAKRIAPQLTWAVSHEADGAIKALVEYVESRGRAPRLEEAPRPIAEIIAQLNPSAMRKLLRETARQELVDASARRSTLDTLLFLALELFNGRGPFASLPLSVQLDIRAFFSSYREACNRADRLLLKLRDDSYVRGAMSASRAGKLTPTALYVHKRSLDMMPTVLRLYEHCAAIAAGRPEQWTLVKLKHDGRAASWLHYPDFDSDPHPRICSDYQVDLRSLKTSHRSYEGSTNRPLLHRKHEFLAPDDPHAARYRRLTDAEVRAGLYAKPHLIGTEAGWEAELARCGWHLKGHRLVKRRPDQASG
ncbi:DNA phosphorothioation-associated putative methyltransferase [Kitasatospora sp. NPDC088783]|uniref:DNA phosphorothioation-associated putative methyltransferase n=1 Tax=Kitasatospora sp. NPDC088783 TaxID=3364077 RepID=UPI0037FEEF59